MLGVFLGLSCALGFAVGDFLAGLASKTTPTIVVAALSRLAAIPTFAIILAIVPASEVTARDITLGVLIGLLQLVALWLLFGVLSRGAMGISVSLTGLLAALLPLVWALSQGESLGGLGLVGAVLGLSSVVVVNAARRRRTSRDDNESRRLDPLQAAAAGTFLGLGLIATGEAGRAASVAPVLIGQVVHATVALIIVAVRRDKAVPSWKVSTQAAASGVFATLASGSFVWAASSGVVSTVAVLQATAPVFVGVIAFVFLRQHLNRLQIVALVLAVSATGLLAT